MHARRRRRRGGRARAAGARSSRSRRRRCAARRRRRRGSRSRSAGAALRAASPARSSPALASVEGSSTTRSACSVSITRCSQRPSLPRVAVNACQRGLSRRSVPMVPGRPISMRSAAKSPTSEPFGATIVRRGTKRREPGRAARALHGPPHRRERRRARARRPARGSRPGRARACFGSTSAAARAVGGSAPGARRRQPSVAAIRSSRRR